MLTYAPWDAVAGLRHAFLERAECADAEAWEPVVARAGAPLPILVPRQVHGTRVATAAGGAERPEADALVSAARGELVGVVTADCVPLLVVERSRRLAAAVHAGWRGMAAGVLEATLIHMRAAFDVEPAALEVVVGPAVSTCCYQVGPEVRAAFEARSARVTAAAWSERNGRDHVDLRLAAQLLLEAAGVRAVAILGPCTSCGAGFASYRRDGASCGRQLSFVGWT